MTSEATSSIPGRRRALFLVSSAEFLGMSVWFSASSVVPVLTRLWNLEPSGQAWLTMSVQIGFVAGALGSALLNLADRMPSRILFSLSSILAGGLTALIPVSQAPFPIVLFFRFLSGVALAGVYPVGMKIIATCGMAIAM